MQCPHCKEEIREGATRCKFCKEGLGFEERLKDLAAVLSGVLTIFVALASLGFAFLEHQGRVTATQEKTLVELDKLATAEILKSIPKQNITSAAKEELLPEREPKFETLPSDTDSQQTLQEIEQLLSKGSEAIRNGREEEAERLFREAANLERTSLRVQKISESTVSKSLGYVYLQKGEWKKAAKEFKKALEQDPKDATARQGLIYSQILSQSNKD